MFQWVRCRPCHPAVPWPAPGMRQQAHQMLQKTNHGQRVRNPHLRMTPGCTKLKPGTCELMMVKNTVDSTPGTKCNVRRFAARLLLNCCHSSWASHRWASSEVEASLIYKVSSRTAWATQRNPVSKKRKEKKSCFASFLFRNRDVGIVPCSSRELICKQHLYKLRRNWNTQKTKAARVAVSLSQLSGWEFWNSGRCL